MYVLIPLILLVVVTLFYVATKEGLEDKKPLGNPMMDKKAVHVDLARNSVELPNHVSGIVSEDLDMGGNVNILNENKIELGRGNKTKGPASGTIQYKNDFLNIIGAGRDGEKSKVKLWDDVEIGSLLNVGGAASVAGPLQIANQIDLGPKDKAANSGMIKYGDMLEITGAGNPRNIKLSDNVQVTGTLTSGMQTGTDQTITGTQTVNNQVVTGTQTLNNNQKLLAGQEVAGVSSYKGKVNINPTESDRRNMVDLSIGDELTGFRKGDKTIMFTGNTAEVGGFDSDGLFVNKPSVLEFGKGEAKEVNAGKIGYQKFSQGLDIVGAGSTSTGRKIKMWDDVEVTGSLKVNGSNITAQGPQFAGTAPVLNATDSITVGQGDNKWTIFVDQGGELRFSKAPTVNRAKLANSLRENDGIALQANGNIWMTQSGFRGLVTASNANGGDNTIANNALANANDARNIAVEARDKANAVSTIANNALSTANDARNNANQFSDKIRAGRSRSGGTSQGRVNFATPFPDSVDPSRIRVTATFNIWGNQHGSQAPYALIVHVVQSSINRQGFDYYCTGLHISGQVIRPVYNRNFDITYPHSGIDAKFEPGEPFDYIAIAT